MLGKNKFFFSGEKFIHFPFERMLNLIRSYDDAYVTESMFYNWIEWSSLFMYLSIFFRSLSVSLFHSINKIAVYISSSSSQFLDIVHILLVFLLYGNFSRVSFGIIRYYFSSILGQFWVQCCMLMSHLCLTYQFILA